MRRFELSLSVDYVSSWGVVEAIRELFQNAIDQESTDPKNTMFFDYQSEELQIGNKTSSLEISSLLLGESTKRDDAKTIGQFGEGYKLAMLVLTRLGKEVTIYNYGAREIWHPKLIQSRRYNRQILVVDVEAPPFWKNTPDNNLTFRVSGISQGEMNTIKGYNLHLQTIDDEDCIDTKYGKILLLSEHKGMIFVNGLWVTNNRDLEFGYDIYSEYIQLDRDRRNVADIDLKWQTSKMWLQSEDERLPDLIKRSVPDLAYMQYNLSGSEFEGRLASTTYAEFQKEYGQNALPVTNQQDLESAKAQYRDAVTPIVVSSAYSSILTKSEEYQKIISTKPSVEEDNPLLQRMREFYDDIQDKLDAGQREEFWEIFKEVQDA